MISHLRISQGQLIRDDILLFDKQIEKQLISHYLILMDTAIRIIDKQITGREMRDGVEITEILVGDIGY